MPIGTPYVPQNITVHLGTPESDAQNVIVPFSDYIKNVASSEIYPTWDPQAISANVFAQTSYALNRVYTEYYRSRGYQFDITNSTASDQKFINGRSIFENIDVLVSDQFDDYIRRIGNIEPLAAKYCNGTTSTCDGLSQWGSEELAAAGSSTYDILTNYYGDDIELVYNAPVQGITETYPGTALRLGSSGKSVIIIQTELNRIAQNYPAIPKIPNASGQFDQATENAVSAFQQIFNLAVDGIVGRATWYKLIFLYVGITNLSELDSEGATLFYASLEYPDAIALGDSGEKVRILQYFLSVIAAFYNTIPSVNLTGYFGSETENAVKAFQQQFGLGQTGVVGQTTWDEMYDVFKGIINATFVENEVFAVNTVPYGGQALQLGSTGSYVRVLQEYLNAISLVYTQITPVMPNGNFDRATQQAVLQYQREFNLPATGIVNQNVWNSITGTYKDVVSSETSRPEQFPGKTLSLGSRDADSSEKDESVLASGTSKINPFVGQPIRSIQAYLRRISKEYKEVPELIPDGIYGAQTRDSVKAFQRHFNIEETGNVDQDTWEHILHVYDYLIEELGDPMSAQIYPSGNYHIGPGEESPDLYVIQAMMHALHQRIPTLKPVEINGRSTGRNIEAVMDYQRVFNHKPTGTIDKKFWNCLAGLYATLISKRERQG